MFSDNTLRPIISMTSD